MSNIFEYIKWRGDLSFSTVRPCAVDAIVFAMLSYIDYSEVAGVDNITLSGFAEKYFSAGDGEVQNLGVIIPSKQINRTLGAVANTKRFGDVVITDIDSRVSEDECCQFSAMTFRLNSTAVMVTFRGTDDSIVGWKEDCCLAYLDEIPAQRMAVEYLESVATKHTRERIYITGHSKGGNLAAYAAVKCSDEVKTRIAHVYSGDGPGLNAATVSSVGFKELQKRITFLIPQASHIGTMFERGERVTVVKSDAIGLLQHAPYSWELDGPHFAVQGGLSARGKKNEERFRSKLAKMSDDEKREFVDTLFSIIESTGAKRLSDFTDGGIKKLITLIKSYNGLDKQKRELMLSITRTLLAPNGK